MSQWFKTQRFLFCLCHVIIVSQQMGGAHYTKTQAHRAATITHITVPEKKISLERVTSAIKCWPRSDTSFLLIMHWPGLGTWFHSNTGRLGSVALSCAWKTEGEIWGAVQMTRCSKWKTWFLNPKIIWLQRQVYFTKLHCFSQLARVLGVGNIHII